MLWGRHMVKSHKAEMWVMALKFLFNCEKRTCVNAPSRYFDPRKPTGQDPAGSTYVKEIESIKHRKQSVE